MIVLPALLSLALTSLPATAGAVQGWGRVNMAGSIVDTACAIEAGSLDQTIDMGVTPISQLIQQNADGALHHHGPQRDFAIRLINCVLTSNDPNTPSRPDWQHYSVTFDGPTDGDAFGVDGDARGVALQIRDRWGNVARPGVALPRGGLLTGDQDLNFTLSLVGNRQGLRPGDFRSTLRFKMDYD